jgi:hypothetical protein
MKRLINIINLTLIIFFCFSCKDSNKDEVTSNNLKTEISYSKKGSDKELISQNDTITANLGDTLNISVNTNGVNMGLFGNDNLDIQESENGEYLCVVKAAGTATVGNLTYTEDSSDYLLVNFYIKVSSKKYIYVVIKDPIFVVNVGNEALQNTIQAELKSASSLNIFNYYKLECKTLQGGNLVYITTAKDTINGTFTSSNILKMNDIAMSYKNSVYNFTLEKATDYNFADGYYLKQDLTERFRVMYPSETINEVSAKALTLKNFY